MLSSDLTVYDLIVATICLIIIITSVLSYQHGYSMGYTEGKRHERLKYRQKRREPEETDKDLYFGQDSREAYRKGLKGYYYEHPTVRIVRRRAGIGLY